MFGRDPSFQDRLQYLQEKELDLAASAEHLQVLLDAQGRAFKRVMPLAMRNLAIVQHHDNERYRLMHGGGWYLPNAAFQLKD